MEKFFILLSNSVGNEQGGFWKRRGYVNKFFKWGEKRQDGALEIQTIEKIDSANQQAVHDNPTFIVSGVVSSRAVSLVWDVFLRNADPSTPRTIANFAPFSIICGV